MSLIYNGTAVERVVYNGEDLDGLYMNGTLVWSSIPTKATFIGGYTTRWGASDTPLVAINKSTLYDSDGALVSSQDCGTAPGLYSAGAGVFGGTVVMGGYFEPVSNNSFWDSATGRGYKYNFDGVWVGGSSGYYYYIRLLHSGSRVNGVGIFYGNRDQFNPHNYQTSDYSLGWAEGGIVKLGSDLNYLNYAKPMLTNQQMKTSACSFGGLMLVYGGVEARNKDTGGYNLVPVSLTLRLNEDMNQVGSQRSVSYGGTMSVGACINNTGVFVQSESPDIDPEGLEPQSGTPTRVVRVNSSGDQVGVTREESYTTLTESASRHNNTMLVYGSLRFDAGSNVFSHRLRRFDSLGYTLGVQAFSDATSRHSPVGSNY